MIDNMMSTKLERLVIKEYVHKKDVKEFIASYEVNDDNEAKKILKELDNRLRCAKYIAKQQGLEKSQMSKKTLATLLAKEYMQAFAITYNYIKL